MGRVHPTSDDMTSFTDGTASAAVHAAVSAHLEAGCAACRTEAARLQATLAVLRRDALTEVPPTAIRGALARVRAARRTDAVRGVVGRIEAVAARIATLLLDTAVTPALAGTRGAIAPVRQVVYEWADDRYTLRIRRGAPPAGYEVMGQILSAAGRVHDVPVHLRPEGARAAAGLEATSSATGEFLFDSVTPGRYSVVVAVPGGEVTLPGLELP